MPPKTARMCIWLEVNETKCYCNKDALLFLANRIQEIAQAPAGTHHELHLTLALAEAETWVLDRRSSDASEVIDDDIPSDAIPAGFEVTFMHIDDSELDEMKRIATQAGGR